VGKEGSRRGRAACEVYRNPRSPLPRAAVKEDQRKLGRSEAAGAQEGKTYRSGRSSGSTGGALCLGATPRGKSGFEQVRLAFVRPVPGNGGEGRQGADCLLPAKKKKRFPRPAVRGTSLLPQGYFRKTKRPRAPEGIGTRPIIIKGRETGPRLLVIKKPFQLADRKRKGGAPCEKKSIALVGRGECLQRRILGSCRN